MKLWMLIAVGLTMSLGALVRAGDNPIPEEFRKALDKAQAVELYSLDPSAPPDKGDPEFHGWKVLGKTDVKKAAQAKLVAAFQKGVAEANPKVSAGCFRPRHGIRVQLDGKPYDFVICFECVAVLIYGGKAEKNAGFHVTRSPADLFNKTLTEAKVKLPKQPDDD
jgi:hypothetical protein